MPIGKGYFWEGLSQGVRGLYGSMQNEHMAREAQESRGELAGARNALARELAGKRSSAMNDDGTVDMAKLYQNELDDAATEEIKHSRALENPAIDEAQKQLSLLSLKRAQARKVAAQKNLTSFAQTAGKKSGTQVVAPEPVAAPRSKTLLEQFREAQEAKRKGIK